jgi:C4-type Zn-finger protein
MNRCPVCGSTRVFRSKCRGTLERFRRQFTSKRPYRCHACDYRWWTMDASGTLSPKDVVLAATTPPDLSAIDAALDESAKKASTASQAPTA